MKLEEEYDPDEILRDSDEESYIEKEDDILRELNLGNESDSKANLNDLVSDIGEAEYLWE